MHSISPEWLCTLYREKGRTIPYYIVTLAVFIVMRLGYAAADNNNLTFLLKPTDTLAGLILGSQSVYLPEKGYYHEALNIVIEKSCSGFNFWSLCFVLFMHLGLKYTVSWRYKMLLLPIAMIGAYMLTVFANSSRIVAAVSVSHQATHILPDMPYLLHEAVGIITYLSFLVAAYYFMEILLKHNQNA